MDTRNWIEIQLPSLGRYYSGKCPDGRIEITPWTTAQEETIIRHSSNPEGSLVDKMIVDNIRLPDEFEYGDLLLTDQHFVLMKLRAISLTCHYTVDFTCDACKKASQQTFDIDTLPVVAPDDEEEWNEPFEVFLPDSKKLVKMRHLRVRDQKAIIDWGEKRPGEGGSTDVAIFQLSRKIVSIEGDENLHYMETMDWIRNLIKIDYDVLRTWIQEYETGIDTTVTVTCPHCRTETPWAIPLSMGFFVLSELTSEQRLNWLKKIELETDYLVESGYSWSDIRIMEASRRRRYVDINREKQEARRRAREKALNG